MAHLGLDLHRTPGNLSSLGLGVHEIHGPPVTVPSWSIQELEWLDLRSAHHLGLWQTLYFPFTTRTPPQTPEVFVALFLPLHSTTEKVTLIRVCCHLFLYQSVDKTLKRFASRGEASLSKDNTGEPLRSGRCNRLKSSSKVAFKGQFQSLRKSAS